MGDVMASTTTSATRLRWRARVSSARAKASTTSSLLAPTGWATGTVVAPVHEHHSRIASRTAP